MYCVKCKKATDTSDVQFVVSKNGKNVKRGTCEICGKHSLSRRRREDRC